MLSAPKTAATLIIAATLNTAPTVFVCMCTIYMNIHTYTVYCIYTIIEIHLYVYLSDIVNLFVACCKLLSNTYMYTHL